MAFKYKIPPYKNSPSLNNNKNNNNNILKNIFGNNNNNNNNKNKNTNNISLTNRIKQLKPTEFDYRHYLVILFIIIVILIIAHLLYYILYDCKTKKPIGQYLMDFSFNPCLENGVEKTTYVERVLEREKEVFHIANQDYTYEQAKCKCKTYGGRLATKEEIIKAYNNGAEWCSYGWSAGQSAYYPTQKCTWDKMQKGDPRHRYDCGMPGVNGGFFANPELKFGVNCYGYKPKGDVVKEKRPICEGKEFCQLNVNYSASHKLDTDEISPFNSKKWSRYD